MLNKNPTRHVVGLLFVSFIFVACSSAQVSPNPTATITETIVSPSPTATTVEPLTSPSPTATADESLASPTTEPPRLWLDVTDQTIGNTGEWTNKVELADVNNDGLVDILLANGGDYDSPGTPVSSYVFLNQGQGKPFYNASNNVFGNTKMLARVIRVRDINKDGAADILVGTTYQTQSRLFVGDASGVFTDVTETNLPNLQASIGDIEFGDVDGDGDLDIVLADWGPGSPLEGDGGRTRLWVNDGMGHFSDTTDINMPDVLGRFSWDLEFVDIDNDFDLDILVSLKRFPGGLLFENDGDGKFTDVSDGRLSRQTNNYDFEAMDINGDGFLDLITINDGLNFMDRVLLNNQQGGFENATAELWPPTYNPGFDDNVVAFLDFDSDGDADFIIGSLNGPDRVLVNDGTGHLTLLDEVFSGDPTPGTHGIALADLNGDGRLDVVQAQGLRGADADKVFFGDTIVPDSAPPVIAMSEHIFIDEPVRLIEVRARIHDRKSPTMPHDWSSLVVRWGSDGQIQESPLEWYGEYLWRATIDATDLNSLEYQVCATDAAGNEACSEPQVVTPE